MQSDTVALASSLVPSVEVAESEIVPQPQKVNLDGEKEPKEGEQTKSLLPKRKAIVELFIEHVMAHYIFPWCDGSQIHINDKNEIWVQRPSQRYPATSWADYAGSYGLNISPTIVTGSQDRTELRVMGGTPPFALAEEIEVALNGKAAWVKEPGIGFYKTSYADFMNKTGMKADVVVTDDDYKTYVDTYGVPPLPYPPVTTAPPKKPKNEVDRVKHNVKKESKRFGQSASNFIDGKGWKNNQRLKKDKKRKEKKKEGK